MPTQPTKPLDRMVYATYGAIFGGVAGLVAALVFWVASMGILALDAVWIFALGSAIAGALYGVQAADFVANICRAAWFALTSADEYKPDFAGTSAGLVSIFAICICATVVFFIARA